MKVYSADDLSTGTTFYKVTDKQVKDYYRDEDNMIFAYLVRENGLEAFDPANMTYGSGFVGDDLYICATDNLTEIEVNGEMVDPEYALEEFDIEDLSEYIQPADDEIIRRYLTKYELASFDLEEVASELLYAGHLFTRIVQAAYELDLLDDIL